MLSRITRDYTVILEVGNIFKSLLAKRWLDDIYKLSSEWKSSVAFSVVRAKIEKFLRGNIAQSNDD